jgi:prepilin-type N-terminal cleavage/methylation domain-containing protein
MKNPGFTLFELVIVIAIISSLSLVVLPNYQKIRLKAQNLAATTNLRTFQAALETQYLENASYPQGAFNGDSLYTALSDIGYLNESLINPFTNSAYTPSDSKGKIVYESSDPETYLLKVFSLDGLAVLDEVTNL